MKGYTEFAFAADLMCLIENSIYESEDYCDSVWYGETAVKSVETFQHAQVLTNDKGLVVTMEDGDVFYITVKKK